MSDISSSQTSSGDDPHFHKLLWHWFLSFLPLLVVPYCCWVLGYSIPEGSDEGSFMRLEKYYLMFVSLINIPLTLGLNLDLNHRIFKVIIFIARGLYAIVLLSILNIYVKLKFGIYEILPPIPQLLSLIHI